MISKDILTYCSGREWASVPFGEKMAQEVLSSLNVAAVQQLAGMKPPRSLMPANNVMRELTLRKKVCHEEWRNMDNHELRALIDSNNIPFEDVFNDILSLRREHKAVGGALICTQLLPSTAAVDDTRTSVRALRPRRYVTAHGTPVAASDGWGRWFFEARIDAIDDSAGGTISIGWDVERSSLEGGPIPGLMGVDGTFGCSFQNDGCLHRGGQGEHFEIGFKQGDIVGVGIDIQMCSVTFLVNGENLPGREGAAAGFRLGNGAWRLHPSVCMFAPRSSRPAQVTLNFTGPFSRLPDPKYDPLSKLKYKPQFSK